MHYIKPALTLAACFCFILAALGLNGRLIAAGLALWVAGEHL